MTLLLIAGCPGSLRKFHGPLLDALLARAWPCMSPRRIFPSQRAAPTAGSLIEVGAVFYGIYCISKFLRSSFDFAIGYSAFEVVVL